jgi:hypothetical protein
LHVEYNHITSIEVGHIISEMTCGHWAFVIEQGLTTKTKIIATGAIKRVPIQDRF